MHVTLGSAYYGFTAQDATNEDLTKHGLRERSLSFRSWQLLQMMSVDAMYQTTWLSLHLNLFPFRSQTTLKKKTDDEKAEAVIPYCHIIDLSFYSHPSKFNNDSLLGVRFHSTIPISTSGTEHYYTCICEGRGTPPVASKCTLDRTGSIVFARVRPRRAERRESCVL